MMNIKKQYIIAIDALRILAILAVVFIHTTTRTLEISGFALQKIPFTVLLNQICRFAVPLFFLISGFVLELNYYPDKNYFTYLKKRLNRIFVPYVFWSAIYYFFVYYQNRNPNFLKVLLEGGASYQLYFIPVLLIFYLLFPFIHKLFKIIGNTWIMIFLFFLQIVLLYFDYSIRPLPIHYLLKIVILSYFPFIFGMFVSRHYNQFLKLINKWKIILLLGALIFGYLVFREGLSGYLATGNYLTIYSQWRPSVLIYLIFLTCFLFWFFNKNIFNNKLFRKLSKLSFFVFFIHIIILEKLWSLIGVKVFQLQFAQSLWWDPVYFIAVSLISFSIAYIVHKIPYLSKLTG